MPVSEPFFPCFEIQNVEKRHIGSRSKTVLARWDCPNLRMKEGNEAIIRCFAQNLLAHRMRFYADFFHRRVVPTNERTSVIP